MSAHDDIKATLDSPGMKYIVHALRSQYRYQWRKLRKCSPEEVVKIQAVMDAIDSLPVILETLLNRHLDVKKDKDQSLWFRCSEWLKRFRM